MPRRTCRHWCLRTPIQPFPPFYVSLLGLFGLFLSLSFCFSISLLLVFSSTEVMQPRWQCLCALRRYLSSCVWPWSGEHLVGQCQVDPGPTLWTPSVFELQTFVTCLFFWMFFHFNKRRGFFKLGDHTLLWLCQNASRLLKEQDKVDFLCWAFLQCRFQFRVDMKEHLQNLYTSL